HTISVLFFSHSHFPHLYLSSFPTRRSADLPVFLLLDRCRDGAGHSHLAHRPGAERDPVVRGTGLSGVGEPDLARPARQGEGPVGDRKSTRLNSSHVKISYAVFCLNQKNDFT